MNDEPKVVIFFLAYKSFKTPRGEQFPFKLKELWTFEIGETVETITELLGTIRETISYLAERHDTNEIYICCAGPLGFIWIFCNSIVQEMPEITFHFLQMARGPEPADKKKYQVWR